MRLHAGDQTREKAVQCEQLRKQRSRGRRQEGRLGQCTQHVLQARQHAQHQHLRLLLTAHLFQLYARAQPPYRLPGLPSQARRRRNHELLPLLEVEAASFPTDGQFCVVVAARVFRRPPF